MPDKPIDLLEGLSPREGSAWRALENLRLAARMSPILVEWVDAVEAALRSDPQRLIYALETALERSERDRRRLETALRQIADHGTSSHAWAWCNKVAREALTPVEDLVNPGGGE